MTRSTIYRVEIDHDSDALDGTHLIQVTDNGDGTRYASARVFGCSRDYRVTDDASAIRRLVAEHGATVRTLAQAKGER